LSVRHNQQMARTWALWATLSAAGLGLILIPDTGPRLFSLSEEHGPSLTDAIGVLLLVAGWATLDIATWRGRRRLGPRRGIPVFTAITTLGAAGLIVWSVPGDHGVWWIVGACVLAAIQLISAARVS
jgi:hypothetical protein